jgi:DNA invertase Pin-like site-specific DNA recombinase
MRCAVYTRKSTEERLDLRYNSLEAQKDACRAYVDSQRHLGWRVIEADLDDGGYSGGSLERPALQQLLELVKAGAIDVVVVHKVDRLSRSLSDFARLAELFDKHRVSFVSVTQQLDTSTAMGRLSMNVLLSFAQFEREIASERIREKIAASRLRGLWTGGVCPLGYRIERKSLIVHDEKAQIVRHLFDRYLGSGPINYG